MYQNVDLQQFPEVPLEDSRIWWGPRPWFYSPVVYRPWFHRPWWFY